MTARSIAVPFGGGGRTAAIQHRVARVLTVGTALGVLLLALGVAGMALSGRSPLPAAGAQTPALDLGRIAHDLQTLEPDAFVWLGLVVLIATPAARVAASLIGFAASRDRAMVVVAAAILAVIAAGVVVGQLGG